VCAAFAAFRDGVYKLVEVGLMLFASVCIIFVNLIEERRTNKNGADPGSGKTRDME
jgi:hypothetical protein